MPCPVDIPGPAIGCLVGSGQLSELGHFGMHPIFINLSLAPAVVCCGQLHQLKHTLDNIGLYVCHH